MVQSALLANAARLGVFIGTGVMVGAMMLGPAPVAKAEGGCPPGFDMATVIGSHGRQACAPVGSITSWGGVEPGALISLPDPATYGGGFNQPGDGYMPQNGPYGPPGGMMPPQGPPPMDGGGMQPCGCPQPWPPYPY